MQSSDWTGTQAYANYRKNTILSGQENNCDKYLSDEYANFNFDHTFDPENADTMNQWLGNDIYNYEFRNTDNSYPSLYNMYNNTLPIFIIFEFEIEYGSLNLIETAYSDVSDTSKVVSLGINNAPYECDTTFKGIEDQVHNEVSATMRYSIDDNTEEYLPVRVFNTYNPMGYITPVWMTNINPQNDYYNHAFYDNCSYLTKDIAVESDMLYLTYEDNLKSDYYGSNVSNRLNTWYFDVFHDKELFPVVKQSIMDSEGNVEYSATNAESVSADYRPNAVFESLSSVNNAESIELTNFDVSCSVGNYSVRETYDITLSNTGSDKIIEFRNLNWQNFIVETYDSVNGENKIYYTGNGKTDAQELSDNDRLLHYVRVNKGETVRMIITIIVI